MTSAQCLLTINNLTSVYRSTASALLRNLARLRPMRARWRPILDVV